MPSLRLILAGEGPLRASFAPARKSSFPVIVEDRPTLLQALDLFVMPSRSEAWGSGGAGGDVVWSAGGGKRGGRATRKLLKIGVSGWLVAPDDPAALARSDCSGSAA